MLAILYAAMAVLYDIKFYKIPNVLCFFTALTGIWMCIIKQGISGLCDCFIGMFVPVIVLYLFFYCRMLGAGDIKELAAMGTFFGKDIWKVIIFSFLFNGVIAMIQMTENQNFKERFCYLRGYWRDCRLEKKLLNDYESSRKSRIHFSIGILCAVIVMVLLNG